VREAYRFLTNNGNHVYRTFVDDVWHKNIPTKVSLFVWRFLRNRLPTKDNLVRRCALPVQDLVCVLSVGNQKLRLICFYIVTFSVLFGLKCCIGWAFLRSFQVTFNIISLNLRIWLDCLESLTHSWELFGLLLFRLFGRKGTTVYSKIRSLILLL